MDYKFIICGIVIILGLIVVLKNKTFAQRMQSFYITQSQKAGGNSEKWERSWMVTLFRAMVIFLGVLVIISAYPIIFGPYN